MDKYLYQGKPVGYDYTYMSKFQTVEVVAWMSNYIPHKNMDVIKYPIYSCHNLTPDISSLWEV